ncbi:DUF6397 family protein [Streptomyces sp. TRM64462]|uniref:DUF6397 family protein n=1 Tax=Streptomyces sp. TRM64462 TaxID=2741726 RepID=UPI001586D30E|nr:DUF6397 family protein [Streptomyces sp. TRM64462]
MTVEHTTRTLAQGRAAQELALRRTEFELAVQLGHVRTVPATTGGRRRVPQEEIDRLRAEPDFPGGLHDRVRTVGTAQAAELARISGDRFTRLARTGHFTPVSYYLNRYRAVVWLYLACEVRDAAARHRELLTGRMPDALRDLLRTGHDARPRAWRDRRLQLLVRQADGPWARAAAIASFLDPGQLAEVVADPYERTHLELLRPAPPPGHPQSAAARDIADRLLRAADPDEILSFRTRLTEALRQARAAAPAPRPEPAARPPATDIPVAASSAETGTPCTGRRVAPRRRTGLLARLGLRRTRAG